MNDYIDEETGTVFKMGCKQPDVLRFSAVTAWDEANPVLKEQECAETERNRKYLGRVRTQKNNNCTNAALAGLLQALKSQAGVEDNPELSMTMQYALHNGGVDEGAFCRDLADDVRVGKRGLCRDSLWGDDKIFVPRGGLPPEVLADAQNTLAVEVYQCLNWDHCRTALSLDFFVYHGTVLGNAFFKTKKDGIVPPWDGRLMNGHAMFSWGLRRINGVLRPITRNTWGESFGDNGDCYFDPSYFWDQRGNFVNLDAYAFRAIKKTDPLPTATDIA